MKMIWLMKPVTRKRIDWEMLCSDLCNSVGRWRKERNNIVLDSAQCSFQNWWHIRTVTSFVPYEVVDKHSQFTMIKKCSRDNTHVLMCRYYIDIHHTHAWINFGFAMVVVVLLLSVDDDGWAYSNSQWLRLLLLATVVFIFLLHVHHCSLFSRN